MVAGRALKFPLPKSYFGKGPLTLEQQAHYKSIATARIEAVLDAEREFVSVHHRQVSSSQWKLLKKKKDIRIYRRRANSGDDRNDDAEFNQPSMLGVGKMDGTLEDLIYGTYDKSYEEMKTTMSFVDIYTKDCNVLHNIELATPQDPFHYVGLKWAVSQLPGKLFVKPRDWCYIEAMGIEKDVDGRRYGYTIVHSLEVPSCPPFDQRSVVRGKGSLSFIYREAGPGVVEIFAQGLFDPAGDLIQYFSVIMTTEIFSGQALTVRCAEAKKLTIMALRNYKKGKREQLKKSCYLCVKSDSMFFSSLKMCNICGVTACEKCRVKRSIFMGPKHSVCDVTCCQSCILVAKTMDVRPAEESFSMHGGDMQRLPADLIVHNTGNSTASNYSGASEKLRSAHGSVAGVDDDVVDTTSEDDLYATMEEADIEKMIEAMIDQRLNDPSRSAHNSRANSQQLDFTVPSASTSYAVDPSPIAVPSPSVPTTAEAEQATLFQKMLALQNAASQVYAITQANEEIMKKM